MKKSSLHVLGSAGVLAFGGLGLASLGFEDASPAAQAMPAANSFTVDGGHSSVLFKVSYQNVANFYGRFNQVAGTYSLDFENPSNSAIDVSIPAESIDSNSEGRDKHLKGPDFFAAREFPTIRFVGNEFEAIDDDTMRVTGDLTLRGVTKPVTVDIDWIGESEDLRRGIRSGFETVLTINRSDYGVSYGIENGALGDTTEITIALTGMKQ